MEGLRNSEKGVDEWWGGGVGGKSKDFPHGIGYRYHLEQCGNQRLHEPVGSHAIKDFQRSEMAATSLKRVMFLT